MSHLPAAEASCAVAQGAPQPLPAWPAGALVHVGQPRPRVSARGKVLGQATYASDVVLPGMVHAVLLRSTIPRGRFSVSMPLGAPGLAGCSVRYSVLPMAAGRPYPPRDRASMAPRTLVCRRGDRRRRGRRRAARASGCSLRGRVRLRGLRRPASPWIRRLSGRTGLAGHGRPAQVGTEVRRRATSAAGGTAERRRDSRAALAEAQHHNPLEPHGCVAAWSEGDRSPCGMATRAAIWSRMGVRAALDLRRRAGARGRPLSWAAASAARSTLQPYHLVAAELSRHLSRPVRRSWRVARSSSPATIVRATRRNDHGRCAARRTIMQFIDERITGQAGPCMLLSVLRGGAASGLRLHRVVRCAPSCAACRRTHRHPRRFAGRATSPRTSSVSSSRPSMSWRMRSVWTRCGSVCATSPGSTPRWATLCGQGTRAMLPARRAAFGWRHRHSPLRSPAIVHAGSGMGAWPMTLALYEA